jgi:hypothetical protein
LLRPHGEILGLWYLNEIGTKIGHFNFTTLNDKYSQKVYEIDNINIF